MGPLDCALASVGLPLAQHGAVEDCRVGCALEVLHGAHVAEEVVADSNLFDGLDGECPVGDGDALHGLEIHSDDVVVDDELLHRECLSELEHSRSVDGVGTGQCGEQGCDCLLVRRLGVGHLGVGLHTGYEHGQSVVLSEFGHSRADNSEFGGSDGCGTIPEVECGGGASVEDLCSGAGQLAQHDSREDLGVVGDEGSGEVDGRGSAGHCHGQDVDGDSVPGSLDDDLSGVVAQLEGAGGADEHGHDGPVAGHLLVSAVVGLEDLEVEVHVLGDGVDVVEVLARVLQGGDHLVDILGSDTGPVPGGNSEGEVVCSQPSRRSWRSWPGRPRWSP